MDNARHQIDIRNTGTTYTTVYIDDVHITGITGIKLSQQAGELPQVMLELSPITNISMVADISFELQEMKDLREKIAKLEKENKRLKAFIQ